MPRPPPRPLCLPELVSNPQKRADFVLANPPKYGPSLSRSLSYYDSSYACGPPSPTSTIDADSHRASGATLASLNSPVTPASSRTSLSVHNLPLNGDTFKSPEISGGLSPGNSSEGKTWNFGRLSLRGSTSSQKPRASWSNAFVNTKSWFGSTTTTEPAEAILTPSSQKEIKLSPSMIAASSSAQSMSNLPVSSPSTSEVPILSPTFSEDAMRSPKVGTGLRYYTERNPAPAQSRFQIPDSIDLQDHDPPQCSQYPSQPDASGSTSVFSFSTSGTPIKELPMAPDVTAQIPATPHRAALKDAALLRCENAGPPSPPPTPPVHTRESNVPHIRVSFGEDL